MRVSGPEEYLRRLEASKGVIDGQFASGPMLVTILERSGQSDDGESTTCKVRQR